MNKCNAVVSHKQNMGSTINKPFLFQSSTHHSTSGQTLENLLFISYILNAAGMMIQFKIKKCSTGLFGIDL